MYGCYYRDLYMAMELCGVVVTMFDIPCSDLGLNPDEIKFHNDYHNTEVPKVNPTNQVAGKWVPV